jgi:hypothetical protein
MSSVLAAYWAEALCGIDAIKTLSSLEIGRKAFGASEKWTALDSS